MSDRHNDRHRVAGAPDTPLWEIASYIAAKIGDADDTGEKEDVTQCLQKTRTFIRQIALSGAVSMWGKKQLSSTSEWKFDTCLTEIAATYWNDNKLNALAFATKDPREPLNVNVPYTLPLKFDPSMPRGWENSYADIHVSWSQIKALLEVNAHLSTARNEMNAKIFDEGLTAWREWLVGLQERLCHNLVAIAFANRECLGTNPLDWVNECIDNYWAPLRPGFKNWAALCCDWANPETWTAPGWLLIEVPEETLRLHIQTFPLAETLDGRILPPYTEVIRARIATLIEMGIHMARISVLDDAKIKIASEPALKRIEQSAASIKLVNEAVYAIGRKYGDEWNIKWLESTRRLYAQLHPIETKPAVTDSSSADILVDETVPPKGKRCHEIIEEMRKIKNTMIGRGHSMSEVQTKYPKFQVWKLVDELPQEERDLFNHPRQWGPVVGQAKIFLSKGYGCSTHTVTKWVKIYRAANPDKRIKKNIPKKSRRKSP